jgi:hypothetical protein
MKFRIEVICVSEDGAEQRSEVRAIERQVAIIGTGREGLAFVVELALYSSRVSFICSYPCVKGVRRTARGIK